MIYDALSLFDETPVADHLLRRIDYINRGGWKQHDLVNAHWQRMLQDRYSRNNLLKVLLDFSEDYYTEYWRLSSNPIVETLYPSYLKYPMDARYSYEFPDGLVVEFRYKIMIYAIDLEGTMAFYDLAALSGVLF